MRSASILKFSFACALICFAALISAQAADRKVAIGAILPLSGDAASIGEAIRNGMALAQRQLPEGARQRFKIHFEDDALVPKNTVSAFHKLRAAHQVAAVICAGSGPCSAIAPIAENANIPLISIASDPEIVLNRHFVVNLWVTPQEEIRVMIPEILRRGYKRVARITTTHDGPLSVNSEMDRQILDRFEIVLDQDYPLDNKDFKDYLARLRVTPRIDAVFLNLYPGQLSSFAKQIRQARLNLPLFGLEMLDDANEIKAAEGALSGAWYVNATDPNGSFIREYVRSYPNSSLMCAANGHDALKLISAATAGPESSDLPDTVTINNFLHSVKNFSGALGTYSSTADNCFSLPAAIKIVPIVN